MEIVLSLSSPTTPLDAGIAPLVAAEAKRVFRSLTPGGQQAVSVTDTADLSTAAATIADFAGEDGGTQTIDYTWTDSADAAVLGYLLYTYDAGVLDTLTFVAVGAEAVTVTPSGAAGTYSAELHAVLAAPVAGEVAEIVVA